jgi:hypothetical protein
MQHPRNTIRSVRSETPNPMRSGGRTARATHPGDGFPDAVRLRLLGIAGLLTVLTFGLAACADDGEWDDPDATPPASEVGETDVRGEDPDRDLMRRGEGGEATPPAGQPMLPSGAILTFEVMETVSTADSNAGDEVRLRLVERVPGTDDAALEVGTTGTAVITEAHESEGPDDEAVLVVHVSSVQVDGSDRALDGLHVARGAPALREQAWPRASRAPPPRPRIEPAVLPVEIWSGRCWWCTRGAFTAWLTLIPKSTTFRMVWSTVVMIVEPPGVPVTKKSSPSGSVTMVGVMAESMRFPGSMAFCSPCTSPNWFGTPGLAAKVVHLVVEEEARAGTVTLLPNEELMVVVTATAFPGGPPPSSGWSRATPHLEPRPTSAEGVARPG